MNINDNWNVINKFYDEQKKKYYFKCECRCGCGEIKIIRCDNYNKYKKICKKQIEQNNEIKNNNNKLTRQMYKTRLIGQKFGSLYVESFAEYNTKKQIIYNCICNCGNKIKVSYTDLTTKRKDNCGCLTKIKQSQAKKKYNIYNLNGKYGIGYTSNTNKEFYFDIEDYNIIKNYCWFEHDEYICARNCDNKKYIRLHRIIMGVTDEKIKVDHIKHNTFDNRKSQLRVVSNQKNTFNHIIHKNNTSGETGVSWDSEKGLWRSRIFLFAKGIHLGYFTNKEDAIKARKDAEEKYFGEYSLDNSMKNLQEEVNNI